MERKMKKNLKSGKTKPVSSKLQASVYDKKGREIKKIDLDKYIYGVTINPNTLYEIYNTYQANSRRIISNTKTRSEVRGGSSKPWRQKGTGRARHGTIRSPLWSGGGITFGPTKDRNYKRHVSKSKKKKALKMALSAKVRDGELVIFDNLDLPLEKTKDAAKLLRSWHKKIGKGKTILMNFPEKIEKCIRSFRNIPYVKVTNARELNTAKILESKYLVTDLKGLKIIEARLSNNN